LSAVLGIVVWVTTLLRADLGGTTLGDVERILLFAPQVVVPLGLALFAPRRDDEPASSILRMAVLFQPFAAMLLILSFSYPAGERAGVLSLGWLIETVLIAGFGWQRVGRARGPAEHALSAGLLFVVIGGAWLALSRFGIRPLGFDGAIVLLTGVHFHYAGFAACLIAGKAGPLLPSSTRPLYGYAVYGMIAGILLLAAGITFSPLIEVLAALLLSASLMVIAVQLAVFIVPLSRPQITQAFFAVAALAIFLGMLIAIAYAWGEFNHEVLVTLAQMARTHGYIHALGFAACGLIGWNLVDHYRS
jgi:hypothetical protein